MGAYNVLNRTSMVAGQSEDISVVLANLDAIAAVLNGGLDNSNVAAGAGITYAKLALAASIVDADIAAGAAIQKSKLGALGIVNADVAAGAAIARSKLDFGTGLVDADIAAAAGIVKTKLAALGIVNADIAAGAAIAISKLAGYPTDATKALFGDGTWAVPPGSTSYRKVSAKIVGSSITETDLLNNDAQFLLAANTINGTNTKKLRGWMGGDLLLNSGTIGPRFKLKYGATVLLDTGVGVACVASAFRVPWVVYIEILALTDTTQSVTVMGWIGNDGSKMNLTTGEGQFGAIGGLESIVGYNAGAATTTASGQLAWTVINGANSASYETKLTGGVWVLE